MPNEIHGVCERVSDYGSVQADARFICFRRLQAYAVGTVTIRYVD